VVMISKGRGQSQALYARLWGSGFLPSRYQGVKFRSSGDPVLYLSNPPGMDRPNRRKVLDVLNRLNEDTFDEFAEQVRGLVNTAADYGCQLLVFPEYFTIQLMTLDELDESAPIQVRRLARHVPAYIDLLGGLAKKRGLYIVGGSIPVTDGTDSPVYNESFFFAPSGEHGIQGKLHMTRWEAEDWHVTSRNKLRLFDTALGRIAITICYDVEFPEIARTAARAGAHILVVPSCTDDRQGYLRVRYCAHARCIENQMYVIVSSTVGSLPMVSSVSLNYGQAAILTPSDFAFGRDGILAEGQSNVETMVIGELNLQTIQENRSFGSVLPLNDSQRTEQLIKDPDLVKL